MIILIVYVFIRYIFKINVDVYTVILGCCTCAVLFAYINKNLNDKNA